MTLVVSMAAGADAQQWFFAWDGTTDLACTPTMEGSNAFFQSNAPLPDCYWEIVDNGSGGKALKTTDDNPANSAIRWKGMGSRPEFYRGPCTTFAMENFHPDHNAFTLAFRIKADSYTPETSAPYKIKRVYNCEFETTTPNPFYVPGSSDHGNPYYTYRVEFGLQKDASGNIWLVDFRYGDNNANGEWNDGGTIRNNRIVRLKQGSSPSQWHTVWAMVQMPPGLTQGNSIYRCWADGSEVYWHDRDKGGWSDCEIGWDGEDQRAVVYFDYLCYNYGAYTPGQVAIPAERATAATNSITTIKSTADGTPCELTGKVVAGIFNNARLGTRIYYITEPDGSDGIRVQHNTGTSPHTAGGSAVTLAIGDTVSIKGGIGSAECEKQIFAHDITFVAAGTSPAVPAWVTGADLTKSFHAALYADVPAQLLATAETGVVTGVAATVIADTGKTWAINQWRNMTVRVPATAWHPDLYYYVVANSGNTLTLAHRTIRFNPPDIVADGVRVGDAYEFVGGRPTGPRLDGRVVRTAGTVTAVNPAAGYFDINDGGGSGDTFTLQDIWDTINYGSAFTPPNGIRVYAAAPYPSLGDYVAAVGCAGAARFKHQVSTTINGSARDEVKIDKVMPVVLGQTWALSRPMPADFDRDGDVDLADFSAFQACFNGPNRPYAGSGCAAADTDADGDVDLTDYTRFAVCFNGPNRPPACQ